MRSLRDYDQSSRWKRLDELSRSDDVDRAGVDHLKASVRKIAEHASWIDSDPGRCIRELLQNALELRELRLKMKQKGEAAVIIGH